MSNVPARNADTTLTNVDPQASQSVNILQENNIISNMF